MEFTSLSFDFPPGGRVNLFRIGDTLIDSGHLVSSCVDELAREVSGGRLEGIEQVLVTHPHIDHVGGSLAIPRLSDLPHVTYEGVEDVLYNYDEHVREIRDDIERFAAGNHTEFPYFDACYPLDFDYPDDISIERRLNDGDIVSLGGEQFEVLHTPGHSPYHLSLVHLDSNVVFSGDVVLPHQQFMWGPVKYDVGAYRRSLSRLREVRPERLVPSHGQEVDEPIAHIDGCLENVDRTLETLRERLNARGRVVAREITDELFGIDGVTGPVRDFFLCTTGTFLEYLADTDDGVTTSVSTEGFVATVE